MVTVPVFHQYCSPAAAGVVVMTSASVIEGSHLSDRFMDKAGECRKSLVLRLVS